MSAQHARAFCRNGETVPYAGLVDAPTPVAALLTELLTRNRMTARALSVYLKVSNSAVHAWLLGQRIPDPRYCWKLAELAHLPVEDVMRLAGEMDDGGLDYWLDLGRALSPATGGTPRRPEAAKRNCAA